MHLTDVEVTDFASGAHFGRQTASIARLGALQCHALVQFLVQGFEDDTHAASAGSAEDMEPSAQQVAGNKRAGAIGAGMGGVKRPAAESPNSWSMGRSNRQSLEVGWASRESISRRSSRSPRQAS